MHQFSSAIKNHYNNPFTGVHLKTGMYIIFNILLMKSNRCLVKIMCRPSTKQIFSCHLAKLLPTTLAPRWPTVFLMKNTERGGGEILCIFCQPSHEMWKSITSLFINIFVYIKLLQLLILNNTRNCLQLQECIYEVAGFYSSISVMEIYTLGDRATNILLHSDWAGFEHFTSPEHHKTTQHDT